MLKRIGQSHKTIISNTFYLSVIQVIRLISPFIALPYIIQTIGVERFGEVVFAQSIAAFSFILINFGLDVSAVKDVSQNRDDKNELSKIVSSVLSIKALLFVLTAILYTIMVLTVDKFSDNYVLFFVAFGIAIPEVIFPVWYYQGIEKMKLLTIVSFVSIAFYISTLFIFVKGAEDYLYVPILQIGGLIISALIGLYMLIKKEKVKIILPSRIHLIKTFKESIPFFTSRASVVINQNIAKIVSGLFLGMAEVAAFELAQKIISAALIPFNMLNQAIYPHNANTQNKSFAKKVFYLTITLSFLVAFAVYILAPIIVSLFAGNDLIPDSVSTLRWLIGFMFFGSIGLYLGAPLLVAWGHPRPFNVSVYLSTITLLIIYLVLYLTNMLSLEFFALALMVVEIVISGYRYYYCKKYKIL